MNIPAHRSSGVRRTLARPLVALLLIALASACAAKDADRKDRKMRAEIARMAAEIDRRIAYEGSHPRKTFISGGTRELVHATYYKVLARRLEEAGTRHYPQKDGKKLYGSLILTIPIYQDGSLYMKEGGPQIEKSSGNPDLDEAALAIVRDAAPFAPIPAETRKADTEDVWIVIDRFTFTRQETPEQPAQETH